MMSYISCIVFILAMLGLWDISQLKATIYWSFSVGALTLFRISKISKEEANFTDAIRDNFRVIVVVEFVVVFYTFNLLVELIIVPVGVIIGMMLPLAEENEEHRVVEKFLTGLMTVFGIFMLGYAIFRIFLEPTDFFNDQTFKDFYLPPLLSILFLPYVYAMVVYISYENAFSGLRFRIKDEKLRTYAKREACLAFRTDTTSLKRWAHTLPSGQIKGRDDIDASILELRTLQARAAAPEYVPFEEGWSPYKAKDFLKESGLQTDFYTKILDGLDEWSASSSHLNLGRGVLHNYIWFHVRGNEFAATSLELFLEINDRETVELACDKLKELGGLLFDKALNHSCPKVIENALLDGSRKEVAIRGKIAKVIRKDWPVGQSSTIKLVIRNADAVAADEI